jgi:PiT family inorganic phosphate transporter
VGALALAALLGASDSANATAALVSARAGSYPGVVAWSVGWHFAGGLLAGSAVARTVAGLVHVPAGLAALTLAAGSFASVAFTWAATHRGFPASASAGLVGGLAGAAVAAGGWRAVQWTSAPFSRHVGVTTVLLGILVAPVLGILVALIVDRWLRRLSFRLTRHAALPLRGGVWLASAAVALADGTNDGQKSMGILAIAVSGSAALAPAGTGIGWEIKTVCAAVLALGAGLGGRQVIVTVSRGLARPGPVGSLAAQAASAGVIFLGAVAALPLATSAVVTSAMIGTGIADRRRHVRWQAVGTILGVWAVTLPACALLGAGIFEAFRLITL